MLFWVAVIAGAGFSYMGLKKGFLAMWAIFFNILISVYLSVMLLPVLAGLLPDSGGQGHLYSCVACMVIVGGLVFAVLQMISSTYLSGGFAVTFPKLFNTIVAAVLGFMSGYLLCCVLIVIVSLMPITDHPWVEGMLGPKNLPGAVREPVIGACDFVGAASMQVWPEVAGDIVDDFIDRREGRLRDRYAPEAPWGSG